MNVSETPQEKALRARLAAHARWGKEDPVEGTRAARRGFDEKFLREVDAVAAERGETLSSAERLRRAESLKRAHMTRLALKSAQARRRRAG